MTQSHPRSNFYARVNTIYIMGLLATTFVTFGFHRAAFTILTWIIFVILQELMPLSYINYRDKRYGEAALRTMLYYLREPKV